MGFEEYADLLEQPLIVGKTVKLPVESAKEIRDLSKRRTDLHKNHHDKTTDWSDNYEALGVIGELAFEHLTGFSMDKKDRLRGDDCDFIINGYKIDVKSTLRSQYVRVKTYRFHEESNFFYVFGKANLKNLYVNFVGWIDGLTFKQKCTLEEKNGHPCYKIHESSLNEINSLSKILNINF